MHIINMIFQIIQKNPIHIVKISLLKKAKYHNNAQQDAE